jgi:hypothetical protein
MKKTLIITLSICVLGLLAPGLAEAKGGKKGKHAASTTSTNSAAILAQFDTDKDGQLSDGEIDALKTDFEANKTEILKEFDVNNDGKLDDSEIGTLKASLAPAAHGKKGKKGKKKSSE